MFQFPRNEDEWKAVANDFEHLWNFPHCLGAVDGKHVEITKPPGSGSYYFNYKGFFSIIMLAIVNANYEFIMVDVGKNGRISDGGAIKETLFYQKLLKNQLQIPPDSDPPNNSLSLPFVFVGDDAFALLKNFMKPYARQNLTDEKRIFNYRLSRARRAWKTRLELWPQDLEFYYNQ